MKFKILIIGMIFKSGFVVALFMFAALCVQLAQPQATIGNIECLTVNNVAVGNYAGTTMT